MLLGQKAHTAGDITRYLIDYTRWLEEGTSLVTAVVTLATGSPSDVSITGLVVLNEHNRIAFLLHGGSVNEMFTVNVQITDSRNETKNDTCQFSVVAP